MAERQIEPLERTAPLRQQVYETLEELIIYGLLTPGQHLVEADLAKRLGVSRIPVREALQLLHSNGWVELRQRQGAFVHRPTLQEVDEVFRVRTLLEVESARIAATNATKESVRQLRRTTKAGAKALAAGDEQALVRLNSEFHAQITALAQNRVLAEMIGRLDKRIRWYFSSVARTRGEDSWKEHEVLIDALESGDVQEAAEVMRMHAELTQAAFHLQRE
ncbi:MAG: GntR family transcriptional regulator [Actinomycetota bacterium]